jgi:hypothetical protein
MRDIATGDRISWCRNGGARMFGEVRRVSASFYVAEVDGTGAYYPVRRGQATREGPL